ncbi:MAG TPA: ATP-binding protein, partial [Spirochaetota bacterium]|nr:ATP-binding protein [Spirochaetota bacterium]
MYKSLKDERDKYRSRIIIISFITAISLVIGFIICDLVRHIYINLPSYLIPLFILITIFVIFLFKKNINIFSYITVITCFAGFLLTSILPNSRDTYILLFFYFPCLVFELMGVKKGIIYSLMFVFLSIILTMLAFMNFIVWNINLSITQFIMGIVTFIILTLVFFFGEVQNKKYIDNLIEMNNNVIEKDKNLHFLTSYLQNIIDATPTIIISTDRDGFIVNWNLFAEKKTLIIKKDAIGKNIFNLLPSISILKEDFYNVQNTGDTYSCEKVEMEINQSRIFKTVIFPINVNGVNGIVFNLTDITEMELIDQKLRFSQKMILLGTLTGGLAHDFNNAMTAISCPISLLKQELSGTSKDKDAAIECIEIGLNHMTGIIKQLQSLSSNKESAFENIDLNNAVKFIYKICNHKFDRKIKLKLELYNESPVVNGDIVQIEELVLNLCINSLHAMTIMREDNNLQSGVLKISTSKKRVEKIEETFIIDEEQQFNYGNYFSISVEDNGVGIKKENIKKIFEPFFTTKKDNGGTGLGLSMVMNIVKKHSGFIEVISKVDKGTTINVFFPET